MIENPFPNTPALKEKALREAATCARCRRKIGQTRLPMFYLVTVERHGVDLDAVNRKAGLEAIVGHPGIATALSPNENMTIPMMERGQITICENCSTESTMVAEFAELVNKKTEAAKKGKNEETT